MQPQLPAVHLHVDMATQFITESSDRAQPELYEELKEKGVIVPLPQV